MKNSRPFLVRPGERPVAVEALARMGTAGLRELYRKLFGANVPAGNSELARRKIAWHLQAESEGGLPESVRQHAIAVARESPVRVRLGENADRRRRGLPLKHILTTETVSGHDSRLPMPGSVLVKTHKGRQILVRVLGSGFEFDGERFTSLTAIAKSITGTKWNGFAFFGLTKEKKRGR